MFYWWKLRLSELKLVVWEIRGNCKDEDAFIPDSDTCKSWFRWRVCATSSPKAWLHNFRGFRLPISVQVIFRKMYVILDFHFTIDFVRSKRFPPRARLCHWGRYSIQFKTDWQQKKCSVWAHILEFFWNWSHKTLATSA